MSNRKRIVADVMEALPEPTAGQVTSTTHRNLHIAHFALDVILLCFDRSAALFLCIPLGLTLSVPLSVPDSLCAPSPCVATYYKIAWCLQIIVRVVGPNGANIFEVEKAGQVCVLRMRVSSLPRSAWSCFLITLPRLLTLAAPRMVSCLGWPHCKRFMPRA
jgi:hypothetical protein